MKAKLIITLLLVAAGIFTGGYAKGRFDAQAQAYAEKAEALQRLIEQQRAIDAENDAIADAWLAQQARSDTITEIVEVEVIQYVPQIQRERSACNLTLGVECLLNARRLDRMPVDECGPLTAAEKQAASPVTTAGLITADIQCADQYAELAHRCDALVDIVTGYRARLAELRAQ